ncbi:hypothetical protein MAR_024442 [Mya arenaria]|uniref:EB domain-containing protein n=1 Tax=Mya arenaria TaxID=6604 RepID=A0ABY7DTW3_MYAAR|nr:hypothetical protein MAR_024442 [Mya arenaria]
MELKVDSASKTCARWTRMRCVLVACACAKLGTELSAACAGETGVSEECVLETLAPMTNMRCVWAACAYVHLQRPPSQGDGASGGHCELGACPLDKLATCTNNMCMCRTGSVAIGGSCRLTGYLGGMCSSTSKCKGKFLTCDTSSMMCVCQGGCRTFHGTPKATQVARYVKSGWFSNNMQTIQFQQTNIVPTK